MAKQSENIFEKLRPTVLRRIVTSLDIEALVGDLPLSKEYQAKLLNYALIEVGVTGLGAANLVPFEQSAAIASKVAKTVTLGFELAGKDHSQDGPSRR